MGHCETKSQEEIKKITEEMGVKFGDRVDDGDLSPNEELMLMVEDLGEKFKGICVETTNGEIQKIIKELREDLEPKYKIKGKKKKIAVLKYTANKEALMGAIWKEINQYSRDDLMKMDHRDPRWTNWCNDVAIYFCHRAVIEEKPIPMAPKKMFDTEEKEEEQEEKVRSPVVGENGTKFVFAPTPLDRAPIPEEDLPPRRHLDLSDIVPTSEYWGKSEEEKKEIDMKKIKELQKENEELEKAHARLTTHFARNAELEKENEELKKQVCLYSDKNMELKEENEKWKADDDNLTKVMSMVNKMLGEAEEKELYFGMEYDSVDGIIDVVKELLDQAESNQKSHKKLSKTVSDLTTDLVDKSKGFQTERKLLKKMNEELRKKNEETQLNVKEATECLLLLPCMLRDMNEALGGEGWKGMKKKLDEVKDMKKKYEELKDQMSQIVNIPFSDWSNGETIETEINKILHPEMFEVSETETESESE